MKGASTAALLRPMCADDVSAVVCLHAKSFPGFFLTTLGPRFVGLFYRAVLQFEQSVGVVAHTNGQVVGCVVGVEDHRAFHRYLRRHFTARAALAAMGVVLRRPTTVTRLLRAFRSSGPQLPHAEGPLLMSVAVDPQYAGAGIGSRLLSAFAGELSRRGFSTFRLTTDRDRNERTNLFYEKAGMILERSYCTPEGRWLNQYVLHTGAGMSS